VAQYLEYIKDPRYLRTSAALGRRPVVFIFNSAAFGSADEPAGQVREYAEIFSLPIFNTTLDSRVLILILIRRDCDKGLN
jgi:hypothetical protein